LNFIPPNIKFFRGVIFPLFSYPYNVDFRWKFDISTLEYREETQHLNDQGPAVDQIDPGEIQGETVSGVSLPHPNINIKESIENAVKEISENINITVSVNKKDQINLFCPGLL
jgi:hypothetical protein